MAAMTVRKPWDNVQSFDEGGGYTSTFDYNDGSPIDILTTPEPVVPLTSAMAKRDEEVTRKRLKRILADPVRTNNYVWKRDQVGPIGGHFMGAQDLTDPSIGLPAATFGFESQRAEWWNTGPEGGQFAPGPASAPAGGGGFSLGGIFDKANDAINPFAWFGSDPVRATTGGVGGLTGIVQTAAMIPMLMLMVMMKGKD